jgi:hypothetical protein
VNQLLVFLSKVRDVFLLCHDGRFPERSRLNTYSQVIENCLGSSRIHAFRKGRLRSHKGIS